jgi:hypothetical protein
MSLVSDIKLIRTDTTLDLSQKAEKGMLHYPRPPLLVPSQRPPGLLPVWVKHPPMLLSFLPYKRNPEFLTKVSTSTQGFRWCSTALSVLKSSLTNTSAHVNKRSRTFWDYDRVVQFSGCVNVLSKYKQFIRINLKRTILPVSIYH